MFKFMRKGSKILAFFAAMIMTSFVCIDASFFAINATAQMVVSPEGRLSLGDSHSAYITENGDLYTWGWNARGQLGDGSTEDSYIPKKIMSNVTQVSLGERHSACITENGDLYMWGYKYGQLDDESTTDDYGYLAKLSLLSALG